MLCRGAPPLPFNLPRNVHRAMGEDLFSFWKAKTNRNYHSARRQRRSVFGDTTERAPVSVLDFRVPFRATAHHFADTSKSPPISDLLVRRTLIRQ